LYLGQVRHHSSSLLFLSLTCLILSTYNTSAYQLYAPTYPSLVASPARFQPQPVSLAKPAASLFKTQQREQDTRESQLLVWNLDET
jgi:hypothetical protein